MTTTKSNTFPHPICKRLYQFIDRKRGDRGLNAFMRDCGLNASRYHNLKRSVPTTDFMVDILQKIGATRKEILWVLGLADGVETKFEDEEKSMKEYEREVMRAMMTMLLEVRNDVRILMETRIHPQISEMRGCNFPEMLAECMAGKTDEELQGQIQSLGLKKMTWEIFQEIVAGNLRPVSVAEVREIKAIVDAEIPGKYTLGEWFCSSL